MGYSMQQYREGLRSLAAGEIQTLMVSRGAAGLGIVTAAREELEAAGHGVLEIRMEMLDQSDFRRVPYLRNGEVVETPTTPFQELFIKAKQDGQLVIIDGMDFFFRSGTGIYLEHLIEAVKTGVRMVWIGDETFRAVCNDQPQISASPDSALYHIEITDEDRLEWLGKQVPHWSSLTQEQRDVILEESRTNGMRQAITDATVRHMVWGKPGVSKGEHIG